MESKQNIGVGVGVMILNTEGQVLLGQRHPDPIKAASALNGEGTWTMPGGKVKFGETLEQASARELFEETGISTEPLQYRLVSIAQDMSETAHFITAGLLLENCSNTPRVCEPDVITSWEWFDLDNLPHPLFFPSERIIANYRDGKIYNPAQTTGRHI